MIRNILSSRFAKNLVAGYRTLGNGNLAPQLKNKPSKSRVITPKKHPVKIWHTLQAMILITSMLTGCTTAYVPVTGGENPQDSRVNAQEITPPTTTESDPPETTAAPEEAPGEAPTDVPTSMDPTPTEITNTEEAAVPTETPFEVTETPAATEALPDLTETPALTQTATAAPTETILPMLEMDFLGEGGSIPQKITAGGEHTCALTETGGAHCWGDNEYGQLGNGKTTSSQLPVDVSGLSTGVTSITAGGTYTCVLMDSGAVKCWGANWRGELGDGTTTDSSVPVDVSGLSSGVAAINAGGGHTCALMETGAVKCWGENFHGQLGNGTTTESYVPVDVSGLDSGVAAITAGQEHTCALMETGAVKCWGINLRGELGDGTFTGSDIPVDVSGLNSGVIEISVGGYHTCALMDTGAVKCWGENYAGQLGDGTSTNSNIPIDVSGLSTGVAGIAAGYDDTCALMDSGAVKCWGNNYYGQLGDGTTTVSRVPVNVSGLNSGVSSVSAGGSHTCALMDTNAIKCWGCNFDGQLGDGTTTDQLTPVDVHLGPTYQVSGTILDSNANPIQGVWLGNYSIFNSATSLEDGSYTLDNLMPGTNKFFASKDGYIFNPTTITASVPPDASGIDIIGYEKPVLLSVSAGLSHTCALTDSGAVKCWGANYSGQLGDGTTISRALPVVVSGLEDRVIKIAAGGNQTCVLTENGVIQCWGDNEFGQLGDGTTTSSGVPVNVSGLDGGMIDIAVGQHFSCALYNTGGVKCWGDNEFGQLGDGTNTGSTIPVDVSGLSSGVSAIFAPPRGYHACALMDSGGVKCWGYNLSGQLGDGTSTDSNIPVDVSGLNSGVVGIAVGGYHTCALMAAGGVKCWGDNEYGQFGDGSNDDSLTPVDVSGLGSAATAITAGEIFTCAMLAQGGVKCWGNNWIGQLGDGTTTDRNVPVDVSGLDGAIHVITAGSMHACALMYSGVLRCWGTNSLGQLGNNMADQSLIPVEVDFTSYTISGMITDSNDAPLGGVALYDPDADGFFTISGADGSYSINNLARGSYSIVASYEEGYTFTPTTITVSVPPDVGNQDFVGTSTNPVFNCASVTEIPSDECDALVALYNSTDGANWTDSSGWLRNNTPCSWYGVSCDDSGVTSIDLGANGLIGTIPPELGNLPQLSTLRLLMNQVSGSIPPELGNLSNLTHFNLEWNQLTGDIPSELGNLSNLEGLFLYGNQLSGSIPSELGNLTKLKYLQLGRNLLSGPLPISLSNLTLLEEFLYEDTELCEPGDADFLVWLNAISYSEGTGDVCLSISGQVKSGINPLSDVTLSILDGEKSTTSASDGSYTLDNLDGGKYSIIPSKIGYVFNPTSLTVTIPPDASDQDFSALVPQPPGKPVLLSPNSGSVSADNTPTLTWNSATDAVVYQIQIDNLSTFASPDQDSSGEEGELTYTADTLTDGTWYWRVRAFNIVNNPGDWSSTRSFIIDTAPPAAPSLSNPVNNAISRVTPAFSWLAAATAANYQFEYDDNLNFSSPVYTSNWLPVLNHTPPTMELGTYYWHVRARDAVGNEGAWSASRVVNIRPQLTAAPALVSPTNAYLSADNTPAFEWNSVPGGQTYKIQIDKLNIFTNPVQEDIGGVGELTYTATTLADGIWYWRVQGLNIFDEPGTWSSIRSFTIDTTPPAAPALSSPANNAISRLTPAFAWLAAATAATYQFEYDDDPNFESPDYTSAWLTTRTHTPPAMEQDTFHWHVRARDAAGNEGAWSASRMVNIYPPIPPAPTLTSPLASAVIGDNTPTFTWNGVTGGQKYHLQIDNLSTFANPDADSIGEVGELTYTATTLADGIWYWHVRALNVLEEPGAWSSARSFTIDTTPPVAPVLSKPANNAISRVTPAFSWLAAATAVNYQFEYDDNPDFNSPDYTSPWLTTLTHTPPAMALGTSYWHVRARDKVGNEGDWSDYRNLDINPPIPASPVLLAPAASSVTSNSTPVFTWNSAADGNTYQIQIDNLTTFASPDQDSIGEVGELTYTATSLADGVWYWRVRALNDYDEPGAWSGSRPFTVDTTPPAVPVPGNPADNAIARSTPTFSWLAVTTALNYQFEYDDDVNFGSPEYTTAWLTTLNHAPPAMELGTFYWHVRARDAAGNQSDWSAYRILDIYSRIPASPALLNPAASSVMGDATPICSWNSAANGSTYQIQIDNGNTFTTPEQDVTGEESELTYTAELLTDGVWYWRVRAFNLNDEPGAWSGYRTFIIDTTPPDAPVLSSPEDNAIVRMNPAFNWSSSIAALKYQFEYDDDSDFGSPEYISAWSTTTNHIPPLLPLGTYYWHVRAQDAVGNNSDWSVYRTLNIYPRIPTITPLIKPAASFVTGDTTPTFLWGKAANGNTYQIQIDNSNSFTTPDQDYSGEVGEMTYNATTLTDGAWFWRVRGFNVNDEPGVWSGYRSFIIDTIPPAAPVLSTPVDDDIVRNTPTFTWGAAASAQDYQVQFDDDSNFSSPAYTSTWITTTSHKPSLMAVGTYYWRVRSRDAVENVGTWSISRIINIYPPLTLGPTLRSPAGSATTRSTQLTFIWDSVTNGNTYQIQIDNNNTFASPEEDYTGGEGELSYTVETLTGGVWYWHVRAINVFDEPGAWSSPRSFTVDATPPLSPVLSSPADNIIARSTPGFKWSSAISASSYQFQYDTAPDFSSPVYTSDWLTTTSHTPPVMTLDSYYWRVRARDAVGNVGIWSTYYIINIYPPIPVAPALLSPAASALTANPTPSFTWSGVTNGNTYQIQIDHLNTFDNPEQTFTGEAGELTYDASVLADGIWYWRVQAFNIYDEPGAWSTYQPFTLDTTPPDAPTLTIPADDTIVRATPTFSWLAAATAVNYQFEYDDNLDFSSPVYTSAWLSTTSHKPLTMNIGAFYWHVRARDAIGNIGTWSTPRIINIYPIVPVAPALLSPAASVVTNDNTPLITWGSVTGGSTYRIQIDNLTTFASPDQDSIGEVGELTFTATSLADGVWYWRVQALNIYDEPGAWSTARLFTIDTLAPAAPALRSPADNILSRSIPTFSWLAAATAVNYQFQYDDAADFSSPIYTSAWIATLTHKPTGMIPGTFYWRVRSRDVAGNESLAWSGHRTIRFYPLPTAPTLTAPVNAVITTSIPTFTWSNVANGATYQIQIDDLATFASPNTDVNALATPSYTPPSLTQGTWYWRVRAINLNNEPGTWSAYRSLKRNYINLVLNPSFDLGTTYAPTSWAWSPYTGACSKMVYTNAGAHSNPKHLATGYSSDYLNCQNIYQDIPATVTSGEDYTLSFWLKSPWAAQTLSYSLQYTGGSSPLESEEVVDLDNTWKCFQTTLNIPDPGDNIKFRVLVNLPNINLDVNIDDVVLTQGDVQICP